ncbi:MAG TPA: vitamin K epoxide reductase family protein, partial [Nitrososphaerales archaeon]|nr:vitamin K epoxide reductase family protein [Nitrososphaerales archaeon]
VVNLALVYVIAFGRESILSRALDILFVWRFIGILIVPYLVFVELFLLKAICLYCTVMHVSIILDFVIISYLLFYKGGGLYPAEGVDDGPGAPLPEPPA